MKDFYYILGIQRNASIHEIKSSFRKLAVKFHPDKNNNDKFFGERFNDIKEAYEILSNDLKRKSYDLKFKNNAGSHNEYIFRKYEEELRNKYEYELRKKEEEIRKRYHTLAQRAKEDRERRKQQEEARKKAEGKKILGTIEDLKRLLLQKEHRLNSLKYELAETEGEIAMLNKKIHSLISRLNKHLYGYKDSRQSLLLHEHPEIFRELNKIKTSVPAGEITTFLKILTAFATTRSIPSGYAHAHPHLIKLILNETILTRPFKTVYAKYKNSPASIEDLNNQLLGYFGLPGFL